MASVIEDHPQRDEIERSIIAGKTLRDIAKCTVPKVSTAAIQRYKAKLVAPVVRNTAKSVARQILAKKAIVQADVSADEIQRECGRSTILQPFLKRVERKYERYDKLLSEAERGNVVLDKLGNPVTLSPDIRGIAALDGQETRTMDFHARALGLLSDSSQNAQTINIAVVLPAPVQPAPGAAGVTLDIAARED